MFDAGKLANAIDKAFSKSKSKYVSKPTGSESSFGSKLYTGKLRTSQLSLWDDSTVNLDIQCQYCKDTRQMKDRCIRLNRKWLIDYSKVRVLLPSLKAIPEFWHRQTKYFFILRLGERRRRQWSIELRYHFFWNEVWCYANLMLWVK